MRIFLGHTAFAAADDNMQLTQEFLAEMICAGRSTVTLAVGVLQHAGTIEYSRGQLRILDRDQLRDAACECYPITQKLFNSLYK